MTHITSRYQGETGLPAKDFPILKGLTETVISALNEGRAAVEKLAKAESVVE